jgi:hypothetical protein
LREASGLYYLEFDRVDDAIGVSFASGTLTSNMDYAYGIYRAAASTLPIVSEYPVASTHYFIGAAHDGSSSTTQSTGTGTPIYSVNETLLGSGITRDTLYDNWPTATASILRVESVDSSIWDGLYTGFYASFTGVQRLYSFVARQAMSSDEWTELMAYVNGKTGAY